MPVMARHPDRPCRPSQAKTRGRDLTRPALRIVFTRPIHRLLCNRLAIFTHPPADCFAIARPGRALYPFSPTHPAHVETCALPLLTHPPPAPRNVRHPTWTFSVHLVMVCNQVCELSICAAIP